MANLHSIGSPLTFSIDVWNGIFLWWNTVQERNLRTKCWVISFRNPWDATDDVIPCYARIYACDKNIERHTAHTIVSWPNPKQWVIVHTSDLMMIIRQSIYILSIITRGVGKLKAPSPTYCIMNCIMDNWDNMLNLSHTLDKIYLTGIL